MDGNVLKTRVVNLASIVSTARSNKVKLRLISNDKALSIFFFLRAVSII